MWINCCVYNLYSGNLGYLKLNKAFPLLTTDWYDFVLYLVTFYNVINTHFHEKHKEIIF